MRNRLNRTLKITVGTAACGLVLAGAALGYAPSSSPRHVAAVERLREDVVRPHELAGFWPLDCPVAQTAAEWARTGSGSVAALRREGFVVGIREPLGSSSLNGTAVSSAARFLTAAGARREAARTLRAAGGSYRVAGIPGARGYTTGYGNVYGVVFTAGRVEYEVRVELHSCIDARGRLAAAAGAVYSRARA
jgi:hypothetical protein